MKFGRFAAVLVAVALLVGGALAAVAHAEGEDATTTEPTLEPTVTDPPPATVTDPPPTVEETPPVVEDGATSFAESAPTAPVYEDPTVYLTKNGINDDGTCKTVDDPTTSLPDGFVLNPGEQFWQFNLTQAQVTPQPVLTAHFSDGTQVTDALPNKQTSGVSMWWVVTDIGATLDHSAFETGPGNTFSDYYGPEPGGSPPVILLISHCITDPQVVKGSVSGLKYYDANVNGQWDAGEPGIAGWPINYDSSTVSTVAGGTFSLSLDPGSYTFTEQLANSPWWQSGNTVNQSSASAGSTATLTNKAYDVTLGSAGVVSGLNFGNVCNKASGGLTLGFWSNKNGQALITSADLLALRNLNLRNANGTAFDPTTNAQVKSFVLGATATNMANMLSAQLTATVLDVRHGFVQADWNVLVDGSWITVQQLIDNANTSLGANPTTTAAGTARTYQEKLKNALDGINNNGLIVPNDPTDCPTPVFTPAA